MHGRILEQRIGQRLLAAVHFLERTALRRDGDAAYESGIFHREETLGDHEIQQYRQRQRAERDP